MSTPRFASVLNDLPTRRRAIQSRAVPTLKILEANPALLAWHRSRFDAESPPPYASSTVYGSDTDPGGSPEREAQEILDAPLTDEETQAVAISAMEDYFAGRKMWEEYCGHLKYLDLTFRVPGPNPPLTYLLRTHVHEHRLHLLARSAVRRRWQALGVWSDDWGTLKSEDRHIAGIALHSCVRGDDGQILQWRWAEKEPAFDETHPAWRAALLRRGLKRGEQPAPPARRSLSRDSSAAEGDSFITSRPWFQFGLLLDEEARRCLRLTSRQASLPDVAPTVESLRARWREQGLWKPQWDSHEASGWPGWKWPHESPSPEPAKFDEYDADVVEAQLSPFERSEYRRLGPKPPERFALHLLPARLAKVFQEIEDKERLKREGKATEPPPRYSRTAPKGKMAARGGKPSAEPTRRSIRVPKMQEKKRKELAEKEEKEEQERHAREAAVAAKQKARKRRTTTTEAVRPAVRSAKTKERTRPLARGAKAPPAKGSSSRARTAARTVKATTKDATRAATRAAAAAAKDVNTRARAARTAAGGATRATVSKGAKTPARGTKRKRT